MICSTYGSLRSKKFWAGARRAAPLLTLAAVAILFAAPARADTYQTYQVTGAFGPCPLTCVLSSTENWEEMPVFTSFSFDFDLGGAGYTTGGSAGVYVGGSDFNSDFVEELGGPTPFHISATYPDPNIDGFPGFGSEEATNVSYFPATCAGVSGPCIPSTQANEPELQAIVTLNADSYAVLGLFFVGGVPGTGTLDGQPWISRLQIYTDSSGFSGIYWPFTANVALKTDVPLSTVPEPGSIYLLLIPAIWLVAGYLRRRRMADAASRL